MFTTTIIDVPAKKTAGNVSLPLEHILKINITHITQSEEDLLKEGRYKGLEVLARGKDLLIPVGNITADVWENVPHNLRLCINLARAAESEWLMLVAEGVEPLSYMTAYKRK